MAKPPGFDLGQTLQQAVALHQQGRLDDAEKLYSRVLKADRNQFDALHLLGMLNHQRGKAGEAFRLVSAALKVNPRSPDALSNLGMVLVALKRGEEGLASVDKALALAPGHLEALNTRGNVLLELKRPAEAAAAFDKVIAAQPRHVIARINRGNALAETNEPEKALVDYDEALKLAPGHPLALYNRGNALHALGRDAEAVRAYDQALMAMPQHIGALRNRGLALAALNRHAEAVASYAKTLAIKPDDADAHFNTSLSLLTLGDYARGFSEYEWRWKRTGMNAKPRFRQPLWLGETPLGGRTILLHAEQGLGDTIQFVRYATLLARAGAKVILEVQPELKDLLSQIEGVSAVFARGETLPAFDVHCPLMSLPLALKTTPQNIPAEIPYLRASEDRIAKWRPKLDTLAAPRVAIAWSGRATHVNDRNRSLTLAALEPLLATPNVRFVSIQRELRAADAERLARDPRILHVGGELDDFSDTAAVLALADLAICVDTSVAHLAGALGRPVWALIPFQPDWRWGMTGSRTPWYPGVELWRQAEPSDWTNVINQMTVKLASGGLPVS
ncbi:tetratricopeptide repeat protein [Leptospira sp. severe_002]|uniref:tetratricopeptide repeat protein n=1 Tax=Leptospira sp. severe_002 TaxID=2838237 RepID=UPI001E5D86E0|nr:tetratricopeptide repeat protein [Leptospira sp. severe_002]